MNVALFVGAGASVELEVPAMAGLMKEFRSHIEKVELDPSLLDRLLKPDSDLEDLIGTLDNAKMATGTLCQLGADTSALQPLHKLRSEVEWFVQHAAERVAAPSATAMWSGVLGAYKKHSLQVVTTNYDRAIEMAAAACKISLADGFGAFGDAEVAQWVGFDDVIDKVRLTKIHGSTDWYVDRTSHLPVKLRHPMPLFGDATLSLPTGHVLTSAFILPSREKFRDQNPYPELQAQMNDTIRTADIVVFVGSSMRDNIIASAARSAAKKKDVFIVNRSGGDSGISEATAITQYASQFLIATLPNALATDDPAGALHAAKDHAGKSGILDDYLIAVDQSREIQGRCDALDRLDHRSITLDPRVLETLLSDPSPQVARFCFGLVANSAKAIELHEIARTCSHSSDGAFAQDLLLLDDVVQSLKPLVEAEP